MTRTFSLPDRWLTAVDQVSRTHSTAALRDLAVDLSSAYRGGAGAVAPLASDEMALAYVLTRQPATFAAIASALSELRAVLPDISPTSVLDLGAGPATVTPALAAAWPEVDRLFRIEPPTLSTTPGEPAIPTNVRANCIRPSRPGTDGRLPRITLMERNPHMIRLGSTLLAKSGMIANVEYVNADLTRPNPPGIAADLVLCTYALGELPTDRRDDAITSAWCAAQQALLIVEPGTPEGYRTIRLATELLSKLGAHIIAPAPPEWPCVTGPSDWLHFSVRVPRTRFLRQVKSGDLGHEDEKFSYLIASRHPGVPFAARVVRHPQTRSGHIRLRICTANGIEDLVVTRSHKEAWTKARKLEWGDTLAADELSILRR